MGGVILSLCRVSWSSQRSGEVTLPPDGAGLYQRDAHSIFSNTDPGLGVTQAQVFKSQGAPLGCRPGEVAYRLSEYCTQRGLPVGSLWASAVSSLCLQTQNTARGPPDSPGVCTGSSRT